MQSPMTETVFDDRAHGYFPPEGGRFRLTLGLKPLEFADWLEIDDQFETELQEKRRLFTEKRDAVFQDMGDTEDIQRELRDFVADNLATYHGTSHQHIDNGMRVFGRRVPFGQDQPMIDCSLLAQEDFLLLQPDGNGSYVLKVAAVCFPTRWKLADKIGKPLTAIHGPVPGYKKNLERQMDRIFGRFTADKPLWRLNYSLLDDATLHQPVKDRNLPSLDPLDAEELGDRLWFRIERQTLLRLPGSGTVVFGVRIHQKPLAQMVTTPDRARDMASALGEMPDDMRDYKAVVPIYDRLQDWLKARM